MNTPTPTDEATLSFPTKEERDALLLEFQRLAARLTRAGLLSRTSATRLARSMQDARRSAEDQRHAFPEALLAILLAIEDGTLKERVDFVRGGDGFVALHLETIATTLKAARRPTWPARELRSLFHFGWLHFREAVRARSERMRFGPEEERRRTVIVHVPSANRILGGREVAVPSR